MSEGLALRERDLVESLRRRQAEQGWNDSRMAAEMGVSRSLWSQVRAGKKHIGTRFAGGIIRRFPTLQDDVALFLRQNVTLRTVKSAPGDEKE